MFCEEPDYRMARSLYCDGGALNEDSVCQEKLFSP